MREVGSIDGTDLGARFLLGTELVRSANQEFLRRSLGHRGLLLHLLACSFGLLLKYFCQQNDLAVCGNIVQASDLQPISVAPHGVVSRAAIGELVAA